MKSFPAQLKTDEHLIDVLVRLDEANVEIRSGSTTLGRWTRSECHFERHAPTSYRFSADGETVSMRIIDDGGFRQALEYVRTERVSIVPRPLVVAGLAAITAAVAFTMLGSVPEPAVAEAAVPTTVVTASPSSVVPAPTAAVVEEAPTSIVDRWNAIAGGTPLQLAEGGLTTVSSTLSVEVRDGSVTVSAIPTSDPVGAERIVAALGLAVAAVDPDLPARDRAAVLEGLGLDVDGDNPTPIEARTVVEGVPYRLSYEPGQRLVFSAGLEW